MDALACALFYQDGLLIRAVENPEVADTLVHTGPALKGWNRQSAPPDAAYAALVRDLSALQETAQAGALARRLNSEISGARSLIMGAPAKVVREITDKQVEEFRASWQRYVALKNEYMQARVGDCF